MGLCSECGVKIEGEYYKCLDNCLQVNFFDKEIMDLLNDFYNNISEAIQPVLEAIKKLADSLSTAFLEAWKEVKFDMSYFDKNISRKRFIKLLMSIGYQRNTANKIAWKYHEEKGEYTLLDFLIENRKKEDLKNDMVRN